MNDERGGAGAFRCVGQGRSSSEGHQVRLSAECSWRSTIPLTLKLRRVEYVWIRMNGGKIVDFFEDSSALVSVQRIVPRSS